MGTVKIPVLMLLALWPVVCMGQTARLGSLHAWGWNYYDQTDVPDGSDFIAVAAGRGHSLGLKDDGSIVAWGRNDYGQRNVPDPNTGFVAVAAGGFHSLGLKDDGSIVAWGYNSDGQGDVPFPITGFVAVAAGGYHNLGLIKNFGLILAWGRNDYNQCNVPFPITGFVAVAAGGYHSLGLKDDGSIVAWGYNSDGQCNVSDPNTGFVAVAAGWGHSLGLKDNGSIVAWGANYAGQCNVPPPNTGFVAVAAGWYHSLGLKDDGSIVAWGANSDGQCNVPDPNTGFVAVAGGGCHSLAIKATHFFTYQGRLLDGDLAADGLYDFQFKLYDAISDGKQLAWTVTADNVDVAEGYFTVELDFGANSFNGAPRWLEIAVQRADSMGTFTTLGPRQRIAPTPYALYALSGPGGGGQGQKGDKGDPGSPGEKGDKGDKGDKPGHQWTATSLRFENPNGTWGSYVDLRGPQGPPGSGVPDSDWIISGNNMYSGSGILGNVGIGTTSPAQKLDVAGTIQMGGFKLTTGASSGYVLTSDASGLGTWKAVPTPPQGITGVGAANYISKFIGTTSVGNSGIYETAGGNVGIGTTSPGTNKLEVQGGPIKATGGLIIETRTSDPSSPVTGRIWLRTDLSP